MANRYLTAAGLGTETVRPQTELSIQGFGAFCASKAPAMGGSFLARKVQEWAKKKWPNYKRGVKFVGSVAVFAFAYALHVAAGKVKSLKEQAALIDRITDGMIGYIGPDMWDTLKSFWERNGGDGQRQLPSGQAAQGIDGNDEDIKDVMTLLSRSPESLRVVGTLMFQKMKDDGANMNDEAKDHIVSSMQQVTKEMANGRR